VRAEFTAGGSLAEQVLQIMLEGLRNTVRHGEPASEASKPGGIRRRFTFAPGRRRRFRPSRARLVDRSRVDDLGGSLKIGAGPRQRKRASTSSYPAAAHESPDRVVIADDHSLFRQGLRTLLRLYHDVDVIGEAERAGDILTVIADHPCDALLFDLQMDRSVLETSARSLS